MLPSGSVIDSDGRSLLSTIRRASLFRCVESKEQCQVHAGEKEHARPGWRQDQDVDRTLRGRVNQNDRGQG